MRGGEAIPMAEYGMPVKSLMVGLVHGHVYITPEPLFGKPSDSLPPTRGAVGGGSAGAGVPPAHARRPRRRWPTRPWLADAERWYATERDGWIGRQPRAAGRGRRRARRRRPSSTTCAGCAPTPTAGYRRHFALHGPDLIPTGLLAGPRARTGASPRTASCPVLTGASPASIGPGPAPRRAASGRVGRLAAPPETIDELRGRRGGRARRLPRRLRLAHGDGLRPRLAHPRRAAVARRATSPGPRPTAGSTPADGGDAAVDAPASLGRRPRTTPSCDQLVHDARATFGVRDDNGAAHRGLARRAAAPGDAGRRAPARRAAGAARRRATRSRSTSTSSSTSSRAGRRRRPTTSPPAAKDRAARSELVPPPTLGPTIGHPARRAARPRCARLAALSSSCATRSWRRGSPGGSRRRRHRRRASTEGGRSWRPIRPTRSIRLEPGDVLVAFGTTPAYNMALSIAGRGRGRGGRAAVATPPSSPASSASPP